MENVEIFQKNGFDFEIDRNVLTEQLSHSVFRRYWWLVLLIGTLSNDDDDGSENVAKKTNLRSFKLNRVDLNPLNMSNAGDFSLNWILKDFIQVKKRRKIRRRMSTSSIKREIRRFQVVVVLWTSKKCTKESNAPAELLFWSLNLLFFEVVVVVVVVA